MSLSALIRSRRHLALYLSFLVVLAAYLIVRWHILGESLGTEHYRNSPFGERVATLIASFGYYVQHTLLPYGLAATPYVPRLTQPWSNDFLLALLFCGIFVAGAIWSLRRNAICAFGLMIFALCLLPVLGLVPMKLLMLEHRAYSAMAGIAFCGAGLISITEARGSSRLWYVTSMLTGIIVAYMAGTYARLPMFRDAMSLWSVTVSNVPDSGYARHELGFAFVDAGDERRAITEFREAIRLDPTDAKSRYKLALALERTGKRQQAIGILEGILRSRPKHQNAINALGVFLKREGDLVRAERVLRKGLQESEDSVILLRNLATVLERRAALDEAVEIYEHLVRLEPATSAHWDNLGRLLHNSGRYEKATFALEEALRVGGETGNRHFALGYSLLRSGRVVEALHHAQRAQQLGHEDPRLLQRLAKAQPG